MKIEHLEHLLRASGKILGETHIFVIGSQSILGKFPHAPAELLMSREADFIPKNKKKDVEKLNEIGELSNFDALHGYHVDPVTEATAILPQGWRGRLINIKSANTGGVTGLCIDPHDLFVSKVAAWREKDISFVKSMIEHRMVDKARVLELASKVVNPESELDRAARIVAKINGLYAHVPLDQTRQVNSNSGRYSGEIIAASDTVVQQQLAGTDVIFHASANLDRVPAVNSTCTIQYRAGRGAVV